MRVGCCAYSYRQYLGNYRDPKDPKTGTMTLESFMQRCSDMDLDGVELTGYYFASTDDAYLNRLKALACKLGLHISGAAVGNNFCQVDPADRARQVADVKKWTDVAYKLGAPCLRVFAGPAPQGRTDEECMGWVVQCLKECAAYAAPSRAASVIRTRPIPRPASAPVRQRPNPMPRVVAAITYVLPS